MSHNLIVGKYNLLKPPHRHTPVSGYLAWSEEWPDIWQLTVKKPYGPISIGDMKKVYVGESIEQLANTLVEHVRINPKMFSIRHIDEVIHVMDDSTYEGGLYHLQQLTPQEFKHLAISIYEN